MLRLTGARRLLCGAATAAVTTLSLANAARAGAASFTVNSQLDAPLGGSVTCAGGSSACTLRGAIQAADAAGGTSTVTLPAGQYKLAIAPPAGAADSDADDPATGDLDVDSGASVALVGGGATKTIIDANGLDRAFAVHTGAGLSVSDLTIEGGVPATESAGSEQGGAIYADGTLSTNNVNFTANASNDGGAIYADTDSALSVNGGSFTGNGTEYGGAIEDSSSNPATIANAGFTRQTAYSDGGDVYYTGAGALTVSDSAFTDNTANRGGAIYAAGSGQVTATGSQFSGDSGVIGGAIFSEDPVTLSLDSFSNDTAASYQSYGGGALYLDGSSSTAQNLMEDQFSADSAASYGGAIYSAGGSLGIAQSSITGGESQGGGAIYFDGGTGLLEDDTIAGNSAVSGGGLYFAVSTPLSMVNDTVAENTAGSSGGGGGIFGTASASAAGDGIVNTIVADNAGGDCNSAFNDSVVTGFDLDSDSSCFGGLPAAKLQAGVQPLLAAPANNGGAVLTMLELPGSPTIATGDAGYCPAADARGVERNPASCDLGAYQAIGTGLSAANAAPASVDQNQTFEIKLNATNAGPGIATNLTLSDQLPAGTTLEGQLPSAGDCTVTGSPAQITCDVGTVAGGSSAGVTLFVAASEPGSFTNTVTVSDDQGATQTASAGTEIVATPSPVKPTITRAAVEQITRTAATLRARLDPYQNPVAYFFEYGPSRQFGRITQINVTNLTGVRSARVTGLLRAHRYYFRLVASTGAQVTYGRTYSFVTRAASRPKPKRPKKHKPTKPKKHKS